MLLTTLWTSCDTTKHLKEGEYLLQSNTVELKSPQPLTRKGELRDNLESIIAQKPNDRFMGMPTKLWIYNSRYEKYQKNPALLEQSRSAEPPVVFDSSLIRRSKQNMESYLFNQGYFYATVSDTTILKGKKAYVKYNVETGTNYLINKVHLDVDDSTIKQLLLNVQHETLLEEGKEFSNSLLDEERARLTNHLREFGYYKFTANNISFKLDTFNKQYVKDVENPFESAINFVALQKDEKKPTLDVRVRIRREEEPLSYRRWAIGQITVFPDYEGRQDIRDSTMIMKESGGVIFKYHNYYVNEDVILRHILLITGRYFEQEDYDNTLSKLNELGVFQTVRIFFREDTTGPDNRLRTFIMLTPSKKYDFFTNVEASNGTTYTLGTALTVGARNRNFARGANFLTVTASGGIESSYYDSLGRTIDEKFLIQTKTLGLNANLDMPKFVAPVKMDKYSRFNLPRTVLGIGTTFLDRVGYFNMNNISSNFTYRWTETKTKRWEATPAFFNFIRYSNIDPNFQARLDTNEFLRNTYSNVFIEGESVVFTFTDQDKRRGDDYSFVRAGVEEAGGLLSAANLLVRESNPEFASRFARYLKIDGEAKHYFIFNHSQLVFRLLTGVGLPYGRSISLPYIKQYYSGGAYSVRGWKVRTLGPGSFVDSAASEGNAIVDRTGDIKLELNGEYRFDIVKLISGIFDLKGAVFTDAGNVWLARKAEDLTNGEFSFPHVANDLAVSSGAGARLVIASFIVLRFDLAMPIKRPTRTGSGWTFKDINFRDSDWRDDNLVFTVGINYPF